jgi:hypothetical protein
MLIRHFPSLFKLRTIKKNFSKVYFSKLTGVEIGNAFAAFVKIPPSPAGVSQRARPQNNKRARPSP